MSATLRLLRLAGASAVVVALAACSGMPGMGGSSSGGTKLSGDQEVPPVTTQASGTSMLKVADDGTVTGSVKTSGVTGTAAHIHNGAAGKNGPVVMPLVKAGDGEWAPAPGARLTAEQMQAYKAGDLYVNVHSEANKAGEVRAQLKP